MIVSLDFDNTLVNTGVYPLFDPTPLPGCLETLDWLKNEYGAKFILLTMRDNYHVFNPSLGKVVRLAKLESRKSVLQDAVQWCKSVGIDLWGINENPGQYRWSDSRKVYADLGIDDKYACTPLDRNGNIDWIELRKILEKTLR